MKVTCKAFCTICVAFFPHSFFNIRIHVQVVNYDYWYLHIITCDSNSETATLAFYLVLKPRKTCVIYLIIINLWGGGNAKLWILKFKQFLGIATLGGVLFYRDSTFGHTLEYATITGSIHFWGRAMKRGSWVVETELCLGMSRDMTEYLALWNILPLLCVPPNNSNMSCSIS